MPLPSGSAAGSVFVVAGAHDALGQGVVRGLLEAGASVAAAVARSWQVDKLRESLPAELVGDRLLVSVVAPRDGEAAAGFVKGAKDALGAITCFVGASRLWRERVVGREPAGDLEELLDANLHANATLMRAVLPSLRRGAGGRMVFVDVGGDVAAGLSATTRAAMCALGGLVDGVGGDVCEAGVQVVRCGVPSDALGAVAAMLAAMRP